MTQRGDDLDEVRERLRGRVSVLVGHSGVGKSTLVNALVPGATARSAHVNAVTGRGRHTSTSRAAAARCPGGGWIVDTPGIRSFGLAHVDAGAADRGLPRPRRAAPTTARAAARTARASPSAGSTRPWPRARHGRAGRLVPPAAGQPRARPSRLTPVSGSQTARAPASPVRTAPAPGTTRDADEHDQRHGQTTISTASSATPLAPWPPREPEGPPSSQTPRATTTVNSDASGSDSRLAALLVLGSARLSASSGRASRKRHR